MKNRKMLQTCTAVMIAMTLTMTGCATDAGTQDTKTPETDATVAETSAPETNAPTETSAETDAVGTQMIELTDPYANQASVDEGLKQELQAGYTFEEPAVIQDPYGISPLSAVVIFTTEEEVGGTVNVKGKLPENDIKGSFPKSTEHIVPIYGLYNGDTTQVELMLDDGRTNTLEITTEKLDIGPEKIEVEMLNAEAYDYSQLTMFSSMAVDAAGDIRWALTGEAGGGVHQLSNGHLMMPTGIILHPMYYNSGLVEMDLSGKVYREYAIPGGQHHDFQELPNGNLLVASDSPDFSTVEDCLVELDRETGEVVWELNLGDLLDKEDGMSASVLTDGAEEIDWFHNNAVWYDEKTDNILLSARHIDAIVAVNKTEKTLDWILGDPTGWELDKKYFFTPVGEDFEWQYAQHQVTMLDNGDIMMFDNGSAKVKAVDNENRVKGKDVYSRAVIYRINTEDMTVEQVFQYGKERGAEWYSDWISGVISTDGTQNHLWVTAGSNLYNPEEDSHDYGPTGMMNPNMIKTSHIDYLVNGELAFELKLTGALTYRSNRVDFYSEGIGLDVNTGNQVLGNFGEKPVAETEVSFDDVQPLDMAAWTFTLDSTKLFVKGTYSTETKAEELKGSFLVLKNGDNVKSYALTQNGTNGDETTNVAVNGWVSPVGLEGNTYEVYLVLDGVTYQTDIPWHFRTYENKTYCCGFTDFFL